MDCLKLWQFPFEITGQYHKVPLGADPRAGNAHSCISPACFLLQYFCGSMDTRVGYGLETGLSVRFSPHYIVYNTFPDLRAAVTSDLSYTPV